MHLISTLRANKLVYLLLCCLAYSAGVCAQAQDGGKPDVRLVIDVSGSMKRNDPKNLRQPAVDLLVRLLPQDSRAGVWTFGKYVNMLVPHRDVSDDWRSSAKEKATEINSVGLFTNIGGALEKASQGVGDGGENFAKSIILLTDGVVDISKDPAENKREWHRIVDEVLPKLKQAGITVHTVALSENADDHLLEKLALATDGTAAVATSADELMSIFLKAFDVAAPAQQVPLVDNGFAIDSSVEEFTALIFRQNPEEKTELVGPDETVFNQTSKNQEVKWFRSDDYDLITVTQPLEGEWKIRANIAPQSRITVVSDLQLRVKSLPSNVYRGAQQVLSFLLQEDGKTLVDQTFLALLDNTATLGYGPDETIVKQVWSHDFSQFAVPENGVYRTGLPLFRDMGTYELALLVDGKTFQRRFQHRITVREPFSAELAEQTSDTGVVQQVLTVRSHSNEVVANKTQIAATIISPSNRKIVKPLSLSEYEEWQTVIHTDKPGQYKVRIQVTGEDIREQPFEYDLEPIELNINPDAAFVAETAVESSSPSSSAAPSSEEASSSLAASSASASAQHSSEAMVEPKATDSGLPPWLLYTLLGVGNLLVLGGGFFVFRKLMSDNQNDDLNQFDVEEELEKAPKAQDKAPAPEPDDSEDLMAMDTADEDDEEPPMEDLEGDLGDDEVAMQAVGVKESAAPDDLDDMSLEDDFGVDDLEDDSAPDSEDEADAQAADMAAEMLKAQGLDLAEDELDDAITNLIDELDGSPPEKKPDEDDIGSDLDDFDFGDDDDDDINKP